MSSAFVTCPVCDRAESARKFAARDPHHGIPGDWWIRECARCGTLFVENAPSQDDLTALYPSDTYYAYTVTEPSRIKRAVQRLVRYSKAPREPEFAAPGRMLDFGCGAGEFLLAMRAKGWACFGVEPNDAARAAARARGLDVRPTLEGSDGFHGESFDYVRANHSLEHVRTPRETLRAMHRMLKPGGTLFVGVPTSTGQNARIFGAHWWHLCPPLHPFVPSTRGLTDLLRQTGFAIAQTRTNSDYGGTAGSVQIALNRRTRRRSSEGMIFTLRPLLLVGHWVARLQDASGAGDKLEVIATRA